MSYRRIAIIAPTLEILGGQGIQANALLKGLRHDGWNVALVPVNPRFPRFLRRLRRRRYLRTAINQAIYLPRLLRLRQADIVHAFSASYWSFLISPLPAMVVGRMLGKRVVLHYHSGEAEDHLSNWGWLIHPWLRLAHEIVVPSDYLRDVFSAHGYSARVIRNVVDTALFRFRLRQPLRPRLLSTRNFEPHYRVENTLQAFALVRRRYPQATLAVAGYGSLERHLRQQATALGAEGISFRGRVDPREMPRLCDDADIFVNSSVIDNQPVSVLEAFAAGLPVVSTGTGDIGRMARDGETGVIVPHDNPEAMAAAVTALIEDPDRANLIARRARQEAEKYAWPVVRQAWAEVYSSDSSPRVDARALGIGIGLMVL